MSHYDPTTLEERQEVAGECVQSLDLSINTYVDDLDDHVNRTYAAWPMRLYLVGLDGKVVYAGGVGPYGFSPAKLEKAIANYLEEVVSEHHASY